MIPFFLSLLITLAAAPVVRWLLLHRGIIDVPNHRSSHTSPTPRGGGLACLLGVMVALVSAQVLGVRVPWLAAGAAIALGAIGFADDRAGLSPVVRLSGQVAGGLLMGVAAGGGWLLVAGAVIAPVVVNIVNFMDGINGITGLSVAVWGATAWLVGLSVGAEPVWVLGAATAGAALGFLPWNAPTARLFLGDVGSYLFGGLIAAGIVVGLATKASPLVLAAPLGLYLADTGTVLVRRAARREPLMEAHREHAYQRLTSVCRLPHIMVSVLVAGLASLVTAAWAFLALEAALVVTAVVCGAFVLAPSIGRARATEKTPALRTTP
ncbi:UDP-N-acetylmuramyl pentapeptide phosphotransferase/UDP-N-acetylglucosamine-1-phosphate transferase [Pedococcus cremeus]|uniref:UDP-N-acetylmuramyl pentapeptide phosphotransferase/UDP-N-acetylglucosamine-1-phosphate transferase n=1 Tax=Pedococcus cremeus TaxID=587636 RepID=A0A1H9RM43_9MICO|nr:hypothetical protein [Pedococcus cremeus]SER73153.1 UDP-N-acetylmuramyl pentapeptide phosphotransferase/UDP-N-acetylglucosamine-1-phosphate transferase [Pedococcus cremeus]